MKTTKKKSFKRLFAFLMAFVMVTALAANAVFAAELSDIADHWAKEHIQNLVDADIIGGYPDGTFKPDNKVTRQEAAKMIALGSGYCEHDGTGSKLVDVADLTWGKENIWALEAADVVNGFGTSKEFRPRLNITRGHVAKMIALAFGLEEGAEEVELKDLPADEKVAEAIRVLASNGIVKGFGTSKEFRPDALVTRGELAKMIDLAMKKSDARVLYVRAINGTTIEVRFSEPVDKDSAERSGYYQYYGLSQKIRIAGVSILPGKLSDDGRVLTLKTKNNTPINVTNATVEVDGVRLKGSSNDRTLGYVGKLTYKDTVRPTIVGVSYPNADTATITFSEPMSGFGNVLISAGTASGYTETTYVVNISTLKEGEKATVTFTGATDHSGNFLSPNPSSVEVVKPAKDEVKPTVESIRVLSDTQVEVVFSEELSSVTFMINNAAVTDYKVADDKVTYTLNQALKDGVNKVEVTVFKDVAGNSGEPVTQQFIVTLDKVAPTLVKSEVLVDAVTGDEYLELTFSKEVKLVNFGSNTFTGTLDYVSGKSFTATPVVDALDKTVVTVPLQNAAKGNWTVTLVKGFVKDLTATGNELAAVDVSFVRGTDVPPSSPAGKVELKSAAVVSGNVVKLTFGGKLDGASAVNKANYAVEGAVVKAAKLTANPDTGDATVELTFEDNSIVTSGNYQVTVIGVKAADGSAVVATPKSISLVENVAPVLKSAVLVNGTDIKLTFSEAIPGLNHDDFKVLVGEVAKTPSSKSGTGAEWIISLGTELNSAELAKSITLELVDTYADTIKDNAGNVLVDFVSLAVTKDIK